MEPLIKPYIEPELLQSLEEKLQEEKQVILHVRMPASPFFGSLVRIWPSTYIIEKESGRHSRLLFAENISYYPQWTPVPPFRDYEFTLIFPGLSKSCRSFDFKEFISEEGGFAVDGISRNESDVYRIVLPE